ncbi:centrosomal protein of 78 kDa [Corchorus olitorius]|uniref:Centrosomal protein of 78 kDa n=1 Tax=Corchorus olitorius TaxID=93759 RepID=A0A1R3HU82_9ROSI|nr:centrosomal protein of 78 kDa [Corchorus olitorius]
MNTKETDSKRHGEAEKGKIYRHVAVDCQSGLSRLALNVKPRSKLICHVRLA